MHKCQKVSLMCFSRCTVTCNLSNIFLTWVFLCIPSFVGCVGLFFPLFFCTSVCVNQAASQWATCWPPQDCAYVYIAIAQHGGFGPGVIGCFNTRHRWVALWACCGGLPSAASSGCPDSKLIRLTVTRIQISSHSVPLCGCLSDSSLPVSPCHFLAQPLV